MFVWTNGRSVGSNSSGDGWTPVWFPTSTLTDGTMVRWTPTRLASLVTVSPSSWAKWWWDSSELSQVKGDSFQSGRRQWKPNPTGEPAKNGKGPCHYPPSSNISQEAIARLALQFLCKWWDDCWNSSCLALWVDPGLCGPIKGAQHRKRWENHCKTP